MATAVKVLLRVRPQLRRELLADVVVDCDDVRARHPLPCLLRLSLRMQSSRGRRGADASTRMRCVGVCVCGWGCVMLMTSRYARRWRAPVPGGVRPPLILQRGVGAGRWLRLAGAGHTSVATARVARALASPALQPTGSTLEGLQPHPHVRLPAPPSAAISRRRRV